VRRSSPPSFSSISHDSGEGEEGSGGGGKGGRKSSSLPPFRHPTERRRGGGRGGRERPSHTVLFHSHPALAEEKEGRKRKQGKKRRTNWCLPLSSSRLPLKERGKKVWGKGRDVKSVLSLSKKKKRELKGRGGLCPP